MIYDPWEYCATSMRCRTGFAARFDDAGLAASPVDRMRELLERIEQADQVELDVFGVGEHHKREFVDSAPPVILAASRSSNARDSSDQRGGRSQRG